MILSLSLLCSLSLAPYFDSASEVVAHGRYVEARTASVFAGPCHYNAELTTAGREALLGWSFEGGAFAGVSLAGARAVASVAGEHNLARSDARRESVLYLDIGASAEQRAALRALLEERYAPVLGRVLAVRVAPIELAFEGDAFRLEVEGSALLAGRALPDRACCSMPADVWYRPLIEADAQSRMSGLLVGYTERCAYDDRPEWGSAAATAAWSVRGRSAPRWERQGENSAFVGRLRILAPAQTGSTASARR